MTPTGYGVAEHCINSVNQMKFRSGHTGIPSRANSILTYFVSIWLTLGGSGGRGPSADAAPLMEEWSGSAFGGGDCTGAGARRWEFMALFRGSGEGGECLVGYIVA